MIKTEMQDGIGHYFEKLEISVKILSKLGMPASDMVSHSGLNLWGH